MNLPNFFSVFFALTLGLVPLQLTRLPIWGSSPAIAQIFPDISDPKIQQYLYADSLIAMGFIEEGIALYDQLILSLQTSGDHEEAARFLQSIASNFQLQGNLQWALIYYEKALAIAELIPPDPNGLTIDINEIANKVAAIYLALGQPDQALIAYEKAVAIDQEFGLQWQGIGTFSNFGTAYQLTGNLEKALAMYQQGLMHSEDTQESYFQAKLLNKIGMLYQAQGKFDLALRAYQKGLVAVTKQPQEYQIVDRVLTLENISHLYRSQGKMEQATDYAHQAEMAIAQASVDEYGNDYPAWGANFLEEIGEFYLGEQQSERAKDYFDRAVAIVHPMPDDYKELNLLNSILVNYRQRGQLAESIPYQQLQIDRATKMGQWESAADLLLELGKLHQSFGHYESAFTVYQQALTLYQTGDRQYAEMSGDDGFLTDGMARTWRAIGKLHEVQDEPEQALTAYQQAIALYPASSTPQFTNSPEHIHLLTTLAEFYTAQGQPDQAQQYREQSHSLRDRLLTPP